MRFARAWSASGRGWLRCPDSDAGEGRRGWAVRARYFEKSVTSYSP